MARVCLRVAAHSVVAVAACLPGHSSRHIDAVGALAAGCALLLRRDLQLVAGFADACDPATHGSVVVAVHLDDCAQAAALRLLFS